MTVVSARVLVVDNGPVEGAALAADLEAAGFEVLPSSDGHEALHRLENEDIDLVLSDVVMPGMNGYELCRQVKALPASQHVPVVLLTSLTDPLDVLRGLEAGADNLLRKPYDPDELPARLRHVLQNRRATEDEEGGGRRLSLRNIDFNITSDRQQMLDTLASTFEELAVTSREVQAREQDLAEAHDDLEQQLHRVDLERTRLGAVVSSIPVPLFVTGQEGRISHATKSLADMLGTAPEKLGEVLVEELADFVDVDGRQIDSHRLPHRRAMSEAEPASMGWAFDVYLVRPDGHRAPVMFHASPIIDESGETAGCVGTLQVLGPLARHDSATGLPNRLAFLDQAASILPTRRDRSAVLLIELDRGDTVRAVLGSAALTRVLADVSRRLRETFQPMAGTEGTSACFLAYLGGEQFGVILVDLPDAMTALRLAETCRRVIASQTATGHSLRVTGSVGVAVGAADMDGPEVLSAAGAALLQARRGGGDAVSLLGPDASTQQLDRLRLENDLRTALDQGDIRVAYQPEVELTTGRVLGFEALARWRHPRRGWVAPVTFIGLAEESGLILELGRQVLERACAEACRWDGWPAGSTLTIAVNVSAVQLRAELVDEVDAMLEKTGLDPSRLLLEVTETAAMGDPALSLPVLARLRARGVRFSLDDFGTGYSSMSHLTRIHFHQLKLDRSFVVGMSEGGPGAIVAQSIVALGQALGVPVLAEGVETSEQAQAMRKLGCEQAQGYLFSRPLYADDVPGFLDACGGSAS